MREYTLPSRRGKSKVKPVPRRRMEPSVKSHKQSTVDGKNIPHGDFGKQALPEHVKRANRALKRKSSAWRPLKKPEPTLFGRVYDRGDLPLAVCKYMFDKNLCQIVRQDAFKKGDCIANTYPS
jgi:hypothetical protein